MMSTLKNRITRAWSLAGFRGRAIAAVVLAGVVATACDVHGVSAPGAVASIVVTPNATLAATSTQQMTAVGYDADGRVVTISPTWSIAAGGGTINGSGLFTAGATTGFFANTVVATVGTISGSASITVTPGILASISLLPNPVTLAVASTQQFVAVGKDAGGNIVQFVPTWTVVAGGGTIDQSGVFTAGGLIGTYTNTVQVGNSGIKAFATVIVTAGPLATLTVTPNPATMTLNAVQQFTAVGKDVAGNVIVITPTWAVVALGGAINANTGLFTAGTVAGTFTNTIRATSGAVSGYATVIVTSGSLASITVTPNPVSMPTNSTQQFLAVGKDANGNVFVITPVWSVAAGGGIISNTGLFTAGGIAGSFPNTVVATSGLISGNASVTVTSSSPPPPPAGYLANGIMAGQSVTCITGGVINADVAISPGNTVTGFGPCVITGVQHLADGVALADQIQLTTAYNTLAGLPCPPANAIVGNLGGTTKAAGVYCTAIGIGVTGVLTLDGGGDPNAQFVFQAGTSLVTAGSVVLINGAQAKNVFWQVGSSATLGTASQWKGNILALTSITLVDNANLIGRALARNGSVTLGTNNVITLP